MRAFRSARITTRLVECLLPGETVADTLLPGYCVRRQKEARTYFVQPLHSGQHCRGVRDVRMATGCTRDTFSSGSPDGVDRSGRPDAWALAHGDVGVHAETMANGRYTGATLKRRAKVPRCPVRSS